MKDISLMRQHIKDVIDDADDVTVEKVFQMLEDEDEGEDPLANMSPEQEASFLRGLKDADEGRTTPHEEVMKKYEKWLTK
jgi:predicted transcriptional regulator